MRALRWSGSLTGTDAWGEGGCRAQSAGGKGRVSGKRAGGEEVGIVTLAVNMNFRRLQRIRGFLRTRKGRAAQDRFPVLRRILLNGSTKEKFFMTMRQTAMRLQNSIPNKLAIG